MFKLFSSVSAVSVIVILTGCQQVTSGLHGINQGLSQITGDKIVSSQPLQNQYKKRINNNWHVTDSQALAWLKHNNPTWNNGGQLMGVNWYDFWKQQLHYHTLLSKAGLKLCHNSSIAGGNCQTFFQAKAMVNSEESRYWGNKMGKDV